MGQENEMDMGEAMDQYYERRVERELDEQRDLRKKFLDGVPAKCFLFWNTGYHPLEGYLNGDEFIFVQPSVNHEGGREFKSFHVIDVQGHLAIIGKTQILGQVWKKVN